VDEDGHGDVLAASALPLRITSIVRWLIVFPVAGVRSGVGHVYASGPKVLKKAINLVQVMFIGVAAASARRRLPVGYRGVPLGPNLAKTSAWARKAAHRLRQYGQVIHRGR
jgi:hypothetical protein